MEPEKVEGGGEHADDEHVENVDGVYDQVVLMETVAVVDGMVVNEEVHLAVEVGHKAVWTEVIEEKRGQSKWQILYSHLPTILTAQSEICNCTRLLYLPNTIL